MTHKTCRHCRRDLPLESFHRDRTAKDGRQARCKACNTLVCARFRHTNPESIRAISRRTRERHRDEIKARNARWKAAHPLAYAAHQKVYRALRSGRLVKPDACSCCGRTGVRIEAHHRDYSRPLDVVWLCSVCHADAGKAGETAAAGELPL